MDGKIKGFKRTGLIVLTALGLVCLIVLGYIACRNFFASDKELFLKAHIKTFELIEEKDEPRKFKTNQKISFYTEIFENEAMGIEGSKEELPITFAIDKTVANDDLSEENFSVNINEKEILKSTVTETDDDEILTVPAVFDKSYSAESYEDVLRELLGFEVYEDFEITDGVNERELEKHLLKYLNKMYDAIPEESFVSEDEGETKRITMLISMKDTVHGVLNEIREDAEFREILYRNSKQIIDNINKRYPYTKDFAQVPEKEEFFKNYDEKLNEFIKNTENSTLTIVSSFGKNNVIFEERVTLEDERYEQFVLYYGEKAFTTVIYDKFDMLFSLYDVKETNGSEISHDTLVSFNITEDREKDIQNPQKLFRIHSVKTADTDDLKEIRIPDKIYNIERLTKEEKVQIKNSAKEKLTALAAEAAVEFIK